MKYHLGSEGQFSRRQRQDHQASVAANPSHLEAVDPVVEGIVRAKIDRVGKGPR